VTKQVKAGSKRPASQKPPRALRRPRPSKPTDQVEKDFEVVEKAIKNGTIQVETGV
jgi:hypothetical protein